MQLHKSMINLRQCFLSFIVTTTPKETYLKHALEIMRALVIHAFAVLEVPFSLRSSNTLQLCPDKIVVVLWNANGRPSVFSSIFIPKFYSWVTFNFVCNFSYFHFIFYCEYLFVPSVRTRACW